MIQQMIENLQHDISILQYYIKNRQAAGFHDMERLVEVISRKILNITYGFRLSNLNLLKVNFPAIDLEDQQSGVVVQVTTNASPSKINKTIAKYESLGLDKKYTALYIMGFCKSSKVKKLKSNYNIINMDIIIQKLVENGNEADVEEIIQIMRSHTDYGKLHPYDDISCLKIVINTIDRNAIKHRMSCEGNYNDMIKGLNEITELISKGQVNQKEKGKSIDYFHDNSIILFLRNVRNDISDITSIINRNKREQSNFVYLNSQDMRDIDKAKKKIVDQTNKIAAEKSINININMF